MREKKGLRERAKGAESWEMDENESWDQKIEGRGERKKREERGEEKRDSYDKKERVRQRDPTLSKTQGHTPKTEQTPLLRLFLLKSKSKKSG